MANSEKAGRRHSESDVKLGRSAKNKARDIIAHLEDLGFDDPAEPIAPLIPAAEDAPQKALDAETPPDITDMVIWGYVKASADAGGEWALDVLANPFGGPDNGKDADGQYFSPQTKFHEDKIPLPPVVYYHGYGDDKRPMGEPEFIGRTVKRWVDGQGVWYRVILDRANKFARRVWEAARAGAARASSGVVLATMRFSKRTGEITSWLNGEVSIFETSGDKRPANSYAVAVPAMKAVYQRAGLVLPDELQTDASDAIGEQQSEAESAGQVVSHGVIEMDEKELIALLDKRDAEKAAADQAAAAAQDRERSLQDQLAALQRELGKAEGELAALKGRRPWWKFWE
mgnify:CR=1 FL=1